jgi:hypothetical protein
MKRLTKTLWALAGVVLGGCSTGSTDGPELVPSDELNVQRNTFTVAVFERNDLSALRGATVVLDKPGGERVEGTTAADGRVTFADVDWSRGSAALTVFEHDHTMVSVVGLDQARVSARGALQTRAVDPTAAPRDYTFFLSRLGTGADRATLSGPLVNKQAAGHFVTLSASIDGSSFQSTGSTFSMDVAKQRPFSVIGLEWAPATPSTVSARGIEQQFFRWVRWDQPALADDAVATLDLATGEALAPVRAKGRLMIPKGRTGPLGAQTKGYVTVTTEAATQLGGTLRSDVLADGSGFEFQLEHVVVPGATAFTGYVIARDDGALTYLERMGYPNDGEIVDDFLLPPTASAHAQPLFEAITFDNVTERAAPRLVVRDGFGVARWIVDGQPGTSTLQAPALGVAAMRQLGNADRARLAWVADYDGATGSYARSAASRELSVSR